VVTSQTNDRNRPLADSLFFAFLDPVEVTKQQFTGLFIPQVHSVSLAG
jgi:hypothetical protein